MIRIILIALVAFTGFVESAAAQIFTLPEIGLQSSGTCRQLAVRDRSNGSMASLGCLDTAQHGWLLTPRSLTIANANTCLSTDGAFATDGTQSWQPSCFGTFVAPGQTVKVYPTRGTAKNAAGLPDDYKMYTSNLIQARGDGSVEKEVNGQFINMETVGGSVSAAGLDSTNATGQLISMRQRPGPNGEKPPTTRGHNVDFHIAPGTGNVQSYGVEYDMNNFNKDCAPGAGCLSSAMFFNGVGGFANTSWLYSGGGATQQRVATGTIVNGTITRASGEAFLPGVFLLTIAGSSYHVHYVSADVAQADEAIPDFPNASSYSWKNAMVHYGILFQGDYNASDADVALNTSAYTGVRVAGHHRVAFDSSGDTAAYALTAKPGQAACLNGFSACFSWTGGYLQYQENGASAFEVVTPSANRNGLRVTSGGAGGGPIIEPSPTSPDANVPLNLRSKGTSPVQVLTGLAITNGGISMGGVNGVSCSGPPTSNFQVTNGIVSRC